MLSQQIRLGGQNCPSQHMILPYDQNLNGDDKIFAK